MCSFGKSNFSCKCYYFWGAAEIDSPSFISGLEKAAQNQTVLMGHRVNEFAVAALDILGKQKYIGTQQSIKDMIQFKMNL